MTRQFVLCLGALMALLMSCGGGGGGSPPPTEVPQTFSFVVTSPPPDGVQVGRPFPLRVDFVRAGSNEPISIPPGEVVRVRVVGGASPISGTTELVTNGTTFVMFTDLVFGAAGEFQLEITSSSGSVRTVTGTFRIGPALDLEFVDMRSVVYTKVPYSIGVRVVDADTRQPVDPGYPVDVKIERADGTPVAQRTIDGTDPVVVGPLVETVASGSTTFRAESFGFPTAVSDAIEIDSLVVAGLARDGSNLVGGDFSLSGQLVGATSGLPAVDLPDLTVSIEPGVPGVLAGDTTVVSNGNAFTFGPLRLDGAGDLVLQVGGPHVEQTTDIVVGAAFSFVVESLGADVALPNEPLGPFACRLEDAGNLAFAGPADPVTWQITRDADSSVVDSGIAAYDSSGVAVIAPRIEPVGVFTVTFDAGSSPSAIGGPIALPLRVEFTEVDAPGPFVALRSTRQGTNYVDSVAYAALDTTVTTAPRFGVLRGPLPDGLALDPATGEIAGAPTTPGDYEFTLWARQSATELQPVRCALAVFAGDESDVQTPAPSFTAPGPYAGQLAFSESDVTFVSSFDGISYQTGYRLWLPPAAAGPAPLFVMHRNRLVGHDDYDGLGQHLASWGIAFVSVEDLPSYLGPGGGADPIYDTNVVEAGMQSGAAFMEAVAVELHRRSADSTDAIAGAIDAERTFYGGHTRGGGSVHAAHVRQLATKGRGYVYLNGVDLRFSSFTAPPGDPRGTPMYPIEAELPRAPSLLFSSEFDVSMPYPLADQLADRRTGPTTFVTVYGGCNAFMTDTQTYDAGFAQITRDAQQAAVFGRVVAFVKRWSGDRSLDGALYGDEAAGSETVGVFSWRNMMERVLVDDFQDADLALNALGFPNTLTAGSRVEESIYPALLGFSSLGLKHNVVYLSGIATTAYATGLGGLDLTDRRTVRFRLGQSTDEGFDWVTVRVRLVDGNGTESTVTVWNALTQSGDLPDYEPGSLTEFDRFVDVGVRLAEFGAVDLSNVDRLEIEFVTDGAADVTRRVYFDDIRVE